MTLLPVAVAHLVAGWAHLYSDSKPVSTGITFLHFAGMLVGGGFAFVADRDAFRLERNDASERSRELLDMASVHRWVIGGLLVVVATGLFMMLADLNTYATSPVFWIKIGLFVLLLANGYGRIRSETAVQRGSVNGWRWLRWTSLASLALWLAVLLVSTVLTVAA